MKFSPVMDFNRVGVFSFENIVDANGDTGNGDDGNLDTNGDGVYDKGNANGEEDGNRDTNAAMVMVLMMKSMLMATGVIYTILFHIFTNKITKTKRT